MGASLLINVNYICLNFFCNIFTTVAWELRSQEDLSDLSADSEPQPSKGHTAFVQTATLAKIPSFLVVVHWLISLSMSGVLHGPSLCSENPIAKRFWPDWQRNSGIAWISCGCLVLINFAQVEHKMRPENVKSFGFWETQKLKDKKRRKSHRGGSRHLRCCLAPHMAETP